MTKIDELAQRITHYLNGGKVINPKRSSNVIKHKAAYFKIRQVIQGLSGSTLPTIEELTKATGLEARLIRDVMRKKKLAYEKHTKETEVKELDELIGKNS